MAEFDWWCRACRLGFYSMDIQESDKESRPLCVVCRCVLIDDAKK